MVSALIFKIIVGVVVLLASIILLFILFITGVLVNDFFREKYFKSRFLSQAEGKKFFIYGKDKKAFIETYILPFLGDDIIVCDMAISSNEKDFFGFPRGFIEYLHKQADVNVNFKKKHKSPYIIIVDDGHVRSKSIRSYVFNEKYKQNAQPIIDTINTFPGK